MATTNPFGTSTTGSTNPALPTFKEAETVNVGSNSTVAGQLNGLIAQNSPYLQAARAGAAKQANSRGLINSSIAAGAGETAAIQAALPIAQQDAATNFNADQFNATQRNSFATDFNRFNQQAYLQDDQQGFASEQAGLDRTQQKDILTQQQDFQGTQAGLDRQQQTALQNSQQQFQGTQAGLDRQQQTALQNSQQQFQGTQNEAQRQLQLTLQQIDSQTRTDLGLIEADYKTLLQTSANASNLYSEVLKTIAGIQLNTSLSADNKATLIQQQKDQLKEGLRIQGAISNLDLASLLS